MMANARAAQDLFDEMKRRIRKTIPRANKGWSFAYGTAFVTGDEQHALPHARDSESSGPPNATVEAEGGPHFRLDHASDHDNRLIWGLDDKGSEISPERPKLRDGR